VAVSGNANDCRRLGETLIIRLSMVEISMWLLPAVNR
jgi:hypothetical protein